MSERTERWATRDLELCHDEELDTLARSKLNDALRRDSELDERYAAVCRVDDKLRAAFRSERVPRIHGRGTLTPLARHAVAAGFLLAVVGLTWWFTFGQRSSRESPLTERPGGLDTSVESEYQSIRVVLSLPVENASGRRIAEHDTELASKEEVNAPEDHRDFLARLDHVLIAGRIEGAFALLDDASERERNAGYRRLGELLRSAQSAEQLLDRLSPTEQMAVCALWAREPVAQPTVFERLRRFSLEPELSPDVSAIVATLSDDRGLRTWLQGYQLVGRGQTRQNAPS